ncbi:glycosyltransferase family 9 protein [Sphaerisporangium sp. B11E5]|uniref:glycosyltransferase family 9 protein n=1 Tax=Sphaerisporangium sp. B11E5 TaxID=3153563 RepID=UPI00325E18CA
MRAGGPGRPVLVVLRGLGLGDLLTVVPTLRGLRRTHPGHRVVLAAPAALAGLLPLIGAVDDLIDVSGTGPVPCREPDIAVNLHGAGPQSTSALLRTGPGRLLTHAHPLLPGVPGPPWDPGAHEVTRWCALLAWHGIPADPADLFLPVPPSSAAGHVVVHPGAAYPSRRWPPERFAEVIAALTRSGHRVLITGGPAERSLADKVAALAHAAGAPPQAGAAAVRPDGVPVPGVQVVAGDTDVAGLAGLVGAARLVICGDTGVAHLATALGTPSVVLFGPVSPALWGPPAGARHIALWAGRSGDPHGDAPDQGLLRIGVSDVVNAALGLLARGEANRPAGERVTMTPCEDGPLLVRGAFTIETQDGRTIDPGRSTVALCRCGRSGVKPFCDGSHKATGFRAPGGPAEDA